MNMFETEVAEKGSLPAFSFPGVYPIYYVTTSNEVLCADCASKEATNVDAHDCHMEGPSLYCDGCNAEIESVYGDPEKGDDKNG